MKPNHTAMARTREFIIENTRPGPGCDIITAIIEAAYDLSLVTAFINNEEVGRASAALSDKLALVSAPRPARPIITRKTGHPLPRAVDGDGGAK